MKVVLSGKPDAEALRPASEALGEGRVVSRDRSFDSYAVVVLRARRASATDDIVLVVNCDPVDRRGGPMCEGREWIVRAVGDGVLDAVRESAERGRCVCALEVESVRLEADLVDSNYVAFRRAGALALAEAMQAMEWGAT